MSLGEFDLIARYFAAEQPLRPDTVLGIGDDCALLQPAGDSLLAVSVDSLVAGVHFLPSVDPYRLGHKALAVNLSDLAAIGAEPQWATLALTLPEANREWLQAFASGFYRLAHRRGVDLVGGDTTRGPLSITIQVMGRVPRDQALRRSGARAGDAVFVSGNLGSAGLGLKIRQGDWQETDAEPLDRLEMPEPRNTLGLALRGMATACIDISDGLAADLGHILAASQVAAEIDCDRLPLSAAVRRYLAATGSWQMPLIAGDDYELCFIAPLSSEAEILELAHAASCTVTRIGHVTDGSGLRWIRNGAPVSLEKQGYQHFSTS